MVLLTIDQRALTGSVVYRSAVYDFSYTQEETPWHQGAPLSVLWLRSDTEHRHHSTRDEAPHEREAFLV